jgi:predicted DNA-binding protein (UPF0251 family)
MPKPSRERRIGYRQPVTFYKPTGTPLSELMITTLNLDELEAMRLVDSESHTQHEAAEHMGISQPTVARLLESGRRKVATALVNGQALSIDQGDAPIEFYDTPGIGHHHGPPFRGRGRRRGRHG